MGWFSGGDCTGKNHLDIWPEAEDGGDLCYDLDILCGGAGSSCHHGSAEFVIEEKSQRKLKSRRDALSPSGAGVAANTTSKTGQKSGSCGFQPMTLYQHDNSTNTTWTLPITTLEQRKAYERNKLPPASASYGAFVQARIALLEKSGAEQFADPRVASLAAELYHLVWSKKHAAAKQQEEKQCSAAKT